MVYAQPSSCPGEWDTQTPMRLWHTNGSPKLGRKTRPYSNQQQQKKKRTCKIVDFAVPADHRIKLNESEKKEKYIDLAREFKKKWNMKVTIIPIVIGAFGTVTKDYQSDWRTWELKDEGRPSKIQHCWEWAEYWEESWRLEETCWHSNASEKPLVNVDVKNPLWGNNNYRICRTLDSTVPAYYRVKLKESERKISAKTLQENWKNCNWHARYSNQIIGTGTGGLGNKRTSGDHPNYNIVEICQNTKKRPGDLWSLAVAKIPV